MLLRRASDATRSAHIRVYKYTTHDLDLEINVTHSFICQCNSYGFPLTKLRASRIITVVSNVWKIESGLKRGEGRERKVSAIDGVLFAD